MAARTATPGRPRARTVGVKVVVPDTAENQVERALANLNAAETRNGRPAPSALVARQRDEEAAKQRGMERVAAAQAAVDKKQERAERAARARRDGNRKAAVSKTVRPAPEKVVEDFDLGKALSDMAVEHLQCRDFRHSWRPFGARWNGDGNYYESILKCGRCGTNRIRKIGRRGQLLGSSYDYADHYVLKGQGRMSTEMNDMVRLASLRAVLIEDTVEE